MDSVGALSKWASSLVETVSTFPGLFCDRLWTVIDQISSFAQRFFSCAPKAPQSETQSTPPLNRPNLPMMSPLNFPPQEFKDCLSPELSIFIKREEPEVNSSPLIARFDPVCLRMLADLCLKNGGRGITMQDVPANQMRYFWVMQKEGFYELNFRVESSAAVNQLTIQANCDGKVIAAAINGVSIPSDCLFDAEAILAPQSLWNQYLRELIQGILIKNGLQIVGNGWVFVHPFLINTYPEYLLKKLCKPENQFIELSGVNFTDNLKAIDDQGLERLFLYDLSVSGKGTPSFSS